MLLARLSRRLTDGDIMRQAMASDRRATIAKAKYETGRKSSSSTSKKNGSSLSIAPSTLLRVHCRLFGSSSCRVKVRTSMHTYGRSMTACSTSVERNLASNSRPPPVSQSLQSSSSLESTHRLQHGLGTADGEVKGYATRNCSCAHTTTDARTLLLPSSFARPVVLSSVIVTLGRWNFPPALAPLSQVGCFRNCLMQFLRNCSARTHTQSQTSVERISKCPHAVWSKESAKESTEARASACASQQRFCNDAGRDAEFELANWRTGELANWRTGGKADAVVAGQWAR